MRKRRLPKISGSCNSPVCSTLLGSPAQRTPQRLSRRLPGVTKQRGFALARGIALQTYERKVSQLINFLPYLHSVIRQYAEIGPERAPEPPLAMYYVEPKATVEVANKQTSIPNFGKYVRRWLQDESARPLAIGARASKCCCSE